MTAEKKKHDVKLTLDQRHDVAVDMLRHARWSVRELTDTELKEQMPHLPPLMNEEFIFADEYAAQNGCGTCITKRGELYLRMVDGF